MNQPVDPNRTRLDLHPAEQPPPSHVPPRTDMPPQAQMPAQTAEPMVEEGVADADHRRRRTVGIVCTVINAICVLFAVVLALHIILVLGSANQANGFAGFINDWSSAVSFGFRDLFVPANEKVRTFLNDGLAAIVWLVIAAALTFLIRRFALPGPRRVVHYRRPVQ